MNVGAIQTRRATIDDLSALKELWDRAHFPVADLERRLTEFQVIQTEDGRLNGCIGLQISEQQGKIHSETYSDSAEQESSRTLLWQRIESVAKNHGLYRLWSNQPSFAARGFQPPDPDLLAKLPSVFRAGDKPWLVLPLRAELASTISLEHEFNLFKQAQREELEKSLQRARLLKLFAGSIAFVLLSIAIGMAVVALRHFGIGRKR